MGVLSHTLVWNQPDKGAGAECAGALVSGHRAAQTPAAIRDAQWSGEVLSQALPAQGGQWVGEEVPVLTESDVTLPPRGSEAMVASAAPAEPMTVTMEATAASARAMETGLWLLFVFMRMVPFRYSVLGWH